MIQRFHFLVFGLWLLAACAHADNDSVLRYAIGFGMKAKVEALLAKGVDVNATDKEGATPLHWAAHSGMKDIAELLLAKGAEVNATDKEGATPLHSAVDQRFGLSAGGAERILATAELLLAKGAEVNATDKEGATPLHWAAHSGMKDIAELLLAKGAEVNAKAKERSWPGRTPLHYAIVRGRKDMAELLLAKGAEVNATDREGSTPLHLIAGYYGLSDSVAPAEFLATAELLLAKGAEVNATDKEGATPLHRAVYVGRIDMAELLLAKGAEVNAKAKERHWPGSTPLHMAAMNHDAKSTAMVELLLAKGADVNATDREGRTPLERATVHSNEATCKLLKEYLAKQVSKEARLREERRLEQTRLLEELIKSNPRAALVQLTAQLKSNPTDDTIRRRIIKLAEELKPAPAISEEARKHFVEGAAIVKAARNPAQQALAAQSFTEALNVAPWWGDAYYNLGVAQELAEQYDKAEQAFTFYLLSNPSEAEQREVQDRIYQLSAKRKLSGSK